MDLYNHPNPHFTRWAVANGYLHEPFIVIDIGVQGGEHRRWEHLGDKVQVYGFDAIAEVIDRLKSAEQPNRHFRALGLGNEDGERQFFVQPDTFGSSFYGTADMAEGTFNDISVGTRTVEMRKLDSLFEAGEIPPADYIKIDCEGFEPEVIRGARQYLTESNVLCVTVETNFSTSPVYMRTPFVDISEMLVKHRLLAMEFNLVRTRRAAYVAALATHPWPAPDIMKDRPDLDVGRVGTADVMFCRDFVDEALRPNHYTKKHASLAKPTADKLIKIMMNFEMHGMMDCAVEIAEHFRPLLEQRFDVDAAIERLCRRPADARNTADVTHCLAMIDQLRFRPLPVIFKTGLISSGRGAAPIYVNMDTVPFPTVVKYTIKRFLHGLRRRFSRSA